MATKRYRKNRKSRKKGGILGIHAFKTESENISNCKKYWSDKYEKNPRRCDRLGKKESTINYPGMLKSNFRQPSIIGPNGVEGDIFNDRERW